MLQLAGAVLALASTGARGDGIDGLPCFGTEPKCSNIQKKLVPHCPDLSHNVTNCTSTVQPGLIDATNTFYTTTYALCKKAANPQHETCVVDVTQKKGSTTPIYSTLICVNDTVSDCIPDFRAPFSAIANLKDLDYAASYGQSCNAQYNPTDTLSLGYATEVFLNASTGCSKKCANSTLPHCQEDCLAKVLPVLEDITLEWHCGEHKQEPGKSPGFVVMLLLLAMVLLAGLWCEFENYTARADEKRRLDAKTAVGPRSINSTDVYEDDEPLLQPGEPHGGADAQDPASPTTADPKPPKKGKVTFLAIVRLFNPTSNWRTLTKSSGARGLQGLDGMRSLSMLWIICAHVSILSTLIQTTDPDKEPQFFQSTMENFVFGAEYGVDTFFFISGMLTSYSLVKKLRSKVKPAGPAVGQAAFFMLFRWLRLTPVYMFVLFNYTYVFPQLSWGPFWFRMLAEAQLCKDSWWTNILYINNFHPTEFHDQCMSWTWYLANDMQFFLIALIVLNLYIRNPKLGAVLQAVLITGCILLGYFVMEDNLPKFQNWYYDKPWMRLAPMVCGLAMGCALRDTDMAKIKLTPVKAFVAMASSIAVLLFCCLINIDKYHDTGNPTTVKINWTDQQSTAYLTFGRLAFTGSIAGITFLCISGNAGIVGSFLSLPIWEPMGKLTYGAYLVHPGIIRVYYFTQTQFFDLSYYVQFITLFGIAVVSYASSIFTFVMIELPFEGIFKLLLT
jgi:peptidoglycan/LPS O-acetylase OafA/YrhL